MIDSLVPPRGEKLKAQGAGWRFSDFPRSNWSATRLFSNWGGNCASRGADSKTTWGRLKEKSLSRNFPWSSCEREIGERERGDFSFMKSARLLLFFRSGCVKIIISCRLPRVMMRSGAWGGGGEDSIPHDHHHRASTWIRELMFRFPNYYSWPSIAVWI